MIYKINRWCGAVEQEIECNALDIIYFFRKFQKYDIVSDLDLLEYLRPFIHTEQYKLFFDKEDVIGYVSWAFLDDLNQHLFRKTGTPNKINGGNNIWLIDVVSTKDVNYQVKWILNYFVKECGINKKINYLRIDQHNNIAKVGSKFTKEYHKWAE